MAKGGRRPGAGRPKGSGKKSIAADAPLLPLHSQADIFAGRLPPAPAMADPEVARQVAALVATGMTEAEIVVVVGIGLRKLRSLYKRELAHGALITRAAAIASLQAATAKGNASASKALLEMMGDPVSADDEGEATPPNSHHEKMFRLLEGGKS